MAAGVIFMQWDSYVGGANGPPLLETKTLNEAMPEPPKLSVPCQLTVKLTRDWAGNPMTVLVGGTVSMLSSLVVASSLVLPEASAIWTSTS